MSTGVPRWKLHLLGYPREEQFDFKSAEETAFFVKFLEDRHIRLLEIAERLPLGIYGPAWDDAFASYLQELGCPLVEGAPYARERIGEYVSWLVSKAFSVIYEESAETTNADAAAAVAEATAGGRAGSAGAGSSSAAGAAAEAPLSAETAAQLSSLASLLGVSTGGGPVDVLAACRRAIRHGLLPAAAAAAAAGASSAGGEGGVGAAGGSGRRRSARPALPPPALTREAALGALPSLPTGVAPSSPAFNAAAAVLRLLYVDELRELQDGITASLVGVQEFTADPRTDASLGQVGR